MRLLELFSGIGAQTKALKNIGVEHETTACEIDKRIHSIYESMHGPTNNFGDVTKIPALPECDLLTYSFPCQDLSILGNRKGFQKDSGTRSSLLWEVDRLLSSSERLPKYLVLENVKQLVSPKNKANFELWLETLKGYGYRNSWKVVNAQDFGLPQKRERVFVVSCLEKDFEFPEGKPASKLSDFMRPEEEVKKEFGDLLYFKDEKMAARIWKTINNTQSTNSTNRIYGRDSTIHALTTQGSHPGNFGAVLYCAGLKDSLFFRESNRNLSIEELRKKDMGFDMDSLRLMSPKESLLLMGFSEKDYDSANSYMKSKKIKNTFFYHVAGNSIAVPVLEAIFRKLLF
jgi:DNA (cytosine-5)-methyltransferase 1